MTGHDEAPPRRPRNVEVQVVEFAAHTAYLDPVTGTGFLVEPLAHRDIDPPRDGFVEVTRSCGHDDYDYRHGLSLHDAGWDYAIAALGRDGWTVMTDENDEPEVAGRTADGQVVLCVYARPAQADMTLDDLERALSALGLAAGLTAERH